MRLMVSASAALVFLAGPAMAQSAKPAAPAAGVCAALGRAVDLGLKRLGEHQAERTVARLATQAAQAATDSATEIAMIGINIDLMQTHHCPMPTAPVSEDLYLLPATTCATATVNRAPDKDQACDRSKWRPSPAPSR
ncbi:hypothetical protein [Phenylobacterium sp.]|jgi:hypothetical protein|uniref:hypothetical protein n=1 Tax=Phenylobacterium sp. TaxID=1871053 RepID=UPI002F410BBB